MSLILVTSDTAASDVQCSHTLDLVFNAMVLLLGLHQLESVGSVERLKKDLKAGLADLYPCFNYFLVVRWPSPVGTEGVLTSN